MPGKVSKSSKNSNPKRRDSRKIRICPFCRKPTLRPADSISGWMTAEAFACSNCGYRGYVYIEVDPDEYERSLKESSSDGDTDDG